MNKDTEHTHVVIIIAEGELRAMMFFSNFEESYKFFDQKSIQWSDSYLCKLVEKINDESNDELLHAFIVMILPQDKNPKFYPFTTSDKLEAMRFFEKAKRYYSKVFLCQVLKGPKV